MNATILSVSQGFQFDFDMIVQQHGAPPHHAISVR